MEENEFMDSGFGQIVDLVKKYEEWEKEKRQVFLDEENYEDIIQFYQDNREPNRALRVIENALEQFSFSAFFYIKRAEILANQKYFEAALAALDEAQKLDPNDINIFLIRSDIALWEGRHEDAKTEVNYALTVATEDEDRCELYLEMADIFEDLEKISKGDVITHKP